MDNDHYVETNIKGRMTPVQFIKECVDDITDEEIINVINLGGFSRNGEVVANSNQEIEFLVRDKITFRLNNLAFYIFK